MSIGNNFFLPLHTFFFSGNDYTEYVIIIFFRKLISSRVDNPTMQFFSV